MIFFRREVITHADNQPYLQRLIIFRGFGFGIYLHRFLGSDDACLHCHPFDFVSILLRGGYFETIGQNWFQQDDGSWCWEWLHRTYCQAGDVLFRPARTAHRIEIDLARPPVSLVFTRRLGRKWGFFSPLAGWVWWKQYTHSEHCA